MDDRRLTPNLNMLGGNRHQRRAARSKRAGYREAISWIARNDDTEWLADEEPIPSVTAALVADLFGKTEDEVTAALRRAVKKEWK